MFRQVLVPLDGSARAAAVLPWAVLLARLTAAEVVLLRVVPLGQARAAEEARATMAAVAAEVLAGEVPIRPEVVGGQPAERILAAARAADLIAMATHGRTGFGRWLLGSVADAVVRGTDRPVLLVTSAVPPPARPTLRRLAVALDGSARAAGALPLGSALARRTGASLILAGSWPWQARMPSSYTRATTVMRLAAWWDRPIRRVLDHVAAGLRGAGLAVLIDLRQGEPAAAVLAVAADHQADLIVVAVPTATGLSDGRVGAVAEAVLRGARVPMIVVTVDRSDEDEDREHMPPSLPADGAWRGPADPG
jgi:nucleotide-binding universal stress UspA family protein